MRSNHRISGHAALGAALLVLSFAPRTGAQGAQPKPVSAREAASALTARLGKDNPAVPDNPPTSRAKLDDSPYLTAMLEPATDRRARVLFATQFDTAGFPMANLGDTVYARSFNKPATVPFVVVARTRYRVGEDLSSCGGDGVSYPGWAYALAPVKPGAAALTSGIVIPWRLPERTPATVTAAQRGALARIVRPIVSAAANKAAATFAALNGYGTAADIRMQVSGTDGLGNFGDSYSPIYSLQGPGGAALAFFSVNLNDDPSDHGQTTRFSMLASLQGVILARSANTYTVYGIADVDGDGIDEIVTDAGIIRWDGHSWKLPPQRESASCD
jgi:hypothetical protein